MTITAREISGRVFTSADIRLIRETVSTFRKLSRKELAATICEILEWTTPNGKPKTESCKRMLQTLEAEGLVRLSPINESHSRTGKKLASHTTESEDISWMDTSDVTECGALEMAIARRGEALSRWRAYIRAYHMIGDVIVYGSQLRYIVKAGGRDVGCVQFSASAWALAARDEWIGWTIADKKQRLHLVLNNSRMLIFPWVRVKCLGSRILSLAAKQVVTDWLEEFCYEPVLLETFVDTAFFHGTIYKAANWTYLGNTKGRGRNDRYAESPLTEKAIYAYPLRHDFRAVLKAEKPWKVVNPVGY